MTDDAKGLEAAYLLKTPEDNKQLYRAWAETYDRDFAAEMDYRLPERVAGAMAEHAPEGPILDIGAGTGLAGAALKALGLGPIHATDISQDMLDVAAGKDIYERLFAGDMTKRLPVEDGRYNAVISTGTFTTGHVGPDALDEVLRVSATGALIAISIYNPHWQAAGFRAKFEGLAGRIAELQLKPVRIYGASAEGEHARDEGKIALFRKA